MALIKRLKKFYAVFSISDRRYDVEEKLQPLKVKS